MDKQVLLFQNLKQIKDYWVSEATDSLNPSTDLIWSDYADSYKLLQGKLNTVEEQEAFKNIQDEIIKGVMHSILVMIDGGDALADKVMVDLVVEESKESLKGNTALHEEFMSYLLDEE